MIAYPRIVVENSRLLRVTSGLVCSVWIVFFFKQKTAYELRISDWSSDVCSSDLIEPAAEMARLDAAGIRAFARSGPGYPSRLREIDDAPPVLYVRGDRKSVV